ncbi:ribonuclease H [Trifolium pratense]|uniref:Ribonuclease H n=1 Tax=Trifolium pratense TaxID=57577 RepID=A0A2K3LHW3_TRIPR|nr:ribonuclease H [Trifolium pratense]
MMRKMDFSEGWLKWMRACICESSMSVLVNGSPTEDFAVHRGLRQGDHLSPFLFLIVAEGVSGMMRKVVEIGRFKGFQVNDRINFQILQFADDTILMGKGVWDNLWTIKVMLRSFELVSGMSINFVKSKLYGLNIDSRLLEVGSTFLSCRFDMLPFKFPGISVGANPRRKETWKPVVEAMSSKLSTWSSRQLSIWGHLTLINSVLASVPLYFFSFFKAPSCVLKLLTRIQRNFLWGGGAEERKALLNKWKWMFLDIEAIWAGLLRFRYSHLPTKILGGAFPRIGTKESIWWKDVMDIGRSSEKNWFKLNVGCGVGDGCVGTDKILNGNGNGVKNYLLMRINSCMNSRIYYKASPFIRIDLIGYPTALEE